jgi:hypothetical protein
VFDLGLYELEDVIFSGSLGYPADDDAVVSFGYVSVIDSFVRFCGVDSQVQHKQANNDGHDEPNNSLREHVLNLIYQIKKRYTIS